MWPATARKTSKGAATAEESIPTPGATDLGGPRGMPDWAERGSTHGRIFSFVRNLRLNSKDIINFKFNDRLFIIYDLMVIFTIWSKVPLYSSLVL